MLMQCLTRVCLLRTPLGPTVPPACVPAKCLKTSKEAPIESASTAPTTICDCPDGPNCDLQLYEDYSEADRESCRNGTLAPAPPAKPTSHPAGAATSLRPETNATPSPSHTTGQPYTIPRTSSGTNLTTHSSFPNSIGTIGSSVSPRTTHSIVNTPFFSGTHSTLVISSDPVTLSSVPTTPSLLSTSSVNEPSRPSSTFDTPVIPGSLTTPPNIFTTLSYPPSSSLDSPPADTASSTSPSIVIIQSTSSLDGSTSGDTFSSTGDINTYTPSTARTNIIQQSTDSVTTSSTNFVTSGSSDSSIKVNESSSPVGGETSNFDSTKPYSTLPDTVASDVPVSRPNTFATKSSTRPLIDNPFMTSLAWVSSTLPDSASDMVDEGTTESSLTSQKIEDGKTSFGTADGLSTLPPTSTLLSSFGSTSIVLPDLTTKLTTQDDGSATDSTMPIDPTTVIPMPTSVDTAFTSLTTVTVNPPTMFTNTDVTTGVTTDVTTGRPTGATTAITPGATTDATTSATTGMATGATTHATTGTSTGVTTGGGTAATSNFPPDRPTSTTAHSITTSSEITSSTRWPSKSTLVVTTLSTLSTTRRKRPTDDDNTDWPQILTEATWWPDEEDYD
ncbi:mucin-5B-like isoform X2 [Frankliniella occidentalis]|uniref:Mucin-5B-like isoform X2 n=1 Tax=Frankliniella occidentalis TaxID=133901 RepID=A0A6J1TJR7_FRAOC|nr:mucin-5B-like isoform X2 [Frankliniella occidentalis]